MEDKIILFKFASRSRPEKFKKACLNIQENCNSKNYFIVCSIDEDDISMNNDDMLQWMYHTIDNFVLSIGKSTNKTHAINRNLDKIQKYDIIVNFSDDMEFLVKGFDDIIRKDMADNFPDGDGVLHYNDGFQKSNVMTMSIMGRKYCEHVSRDIYGLNELVIYHPSYESVWSDVEATEVAYMLGKYKYIGNDHQIFVHNHPVWKKAEWDEQYRKSEDARVYARDHEVIIKRRSINYGIPPEEIKNPFKYATI